MSQFYTNVALSKNEILLRGVENGKRISRKIPYKPYLFIPTKKETKYQTLDGKPVGRVDFDSVREARNFLKEYEDVGGMPIYGLEKFPYTFIYDEYKSGGDIMYDPSLISVVSIDIEVSISGDKGFPDIQVASNEVTLITMSRNGQKVVFGCGDFVNSFDDVEYFKCADEAALLRSFVDMWNSPRYSPDVVTGWNVDFFDIPYLVNRITRVLGDSWAKKLSPWGYLQEKKIEIMGKEAQIYIPVGITILDYLQLYKKFAYTQQESYKLDHVAYEELGERKLEFDGTLAELEVGDYQKYVEYNIHDVRLVDMLDDKLKLIELVYAMAYDAGVNYQDTFTTVGLWDVIIHNHLMKQGIVIHQFDKASRDEPILGGYVKDPKPGMYNWVVSLDLNSLYPHIIMQYNISPETYLGWVPEEGECENKDQAEARVIRALNGAMNNYQDYMQNDNVVISANMCMFSREKQGFLPALMQKMYNDRVVYKNQMIEAKKSYELEGANKAQLTKDIARFNNLQMAKKIQLNSGYGALANVWNRWFKREFAEGITSSAQLTTRWIEIKLNQYLNKIFKTDGYDYVIACDTDSVYVHADKFVELAGKEMTTEQTVKYIDKICIEALEPFIDKKYQELSDYVNGYDQKMKMKRECIADKGIWTAKKRYILNVWNQEGVQYTTPKLKMMGIEAIRTSTPAIVRTAIKDALNVIINKTEEDLQQFIKDFREEFCKMPFEQVAFPRSVRDLDKYKDAATIYAKGTPINVKGALIFNHLLRKRKLDNKYEPVANGQKIKYSYMKMPNPYQCTVITCPDKLPPELGLDKYVDHDTQFDKSFLEPIKTIVAAIGWEVEKRATLEQWFS
jgi:DNA polymerase elongation subunit (family B)